MKQLVTFFAVFLFCVAQASASSATSIDQINAINSERINNAPVNNGLINNGLSNDSLASLPLQAVGSGKMSWLFWDLYHITYYSESGKYQADALPQALSIQYLKDIDKEDLVTATKDQWQHLHIDWQQQWVEQINQLWPHIKKNDRLTLIISQDGFSHFYYNQQRLGLINDSEFSKAFAAIWLSPNTSEPKLRKILINDN